MRLAWSPSGTECYILIFLPFEFFVEFGFSICGERWLPGLLRVGYYVLLTTRTGYECFIYIFDSFTFPASKYVLLRFSVWLDCPYVPQYLVWCNHIPSVQSLLWPSVALSELTLSYLTLSYLTLSFLTLSYLTLSYLTLSYLTIFVLISISRTKEVLHIALSWWLSSGSQFY